MSESLRKCPVCGDVTDYVCPCNDDPVTPSRASAADLLREGYGYVRVLSLGHPRAVDGRVMEHILIVEKALGKPLPLGAQVHHVNEKKADNRSENLVVCQDQ